jgi:flagellar basal-body rod protein FlgB
MKIFNSKNIQLLKKSLDVYEKQHEAIAKNIANANNAEYTRVKTDFSDVLKTNVQGKMRVTNSKHINQMSEPLRISAGNENSTKERVDMSKEMGELAENQIRFDFVSRTLARAYRALNMSITGRSS